MQFEPILLLNSSYEPLATINWQRAMILLFQHKVEVLEEQNHVVRSPSKTYSLPSVIRMFEYVRNKSQRAVPLTRRHVYLRDDHTCQYCARQFRVGDLTLDHVLPRVQNGKTIWTNIVTCCFVCNRKKGGHTPEQKGMRLLKPPVRPTWKNVLLVHLQNGTVPATWKQYVHM